MESFCRFLGQSPKNLLKLSFYEKFPHQETRWKSMYFTQYHPQIYLRETYFRFAPIFCACIASNIFPWCPYLLVCISAVTFPDIEGGSVGASPDRQSSSLALSIPTPIPIPTAREIMIRSKLSTTTVSLLIPPSEGF